MSHSFKISLASLVLVIFAFVMIAIHSFLNFTESPMDFRRGPPQYKTVKPDSSLQRKEVLSLERHEDIFKTFQRQEDVERCSTFESSIRNAEKNSFPLVAFATYPRSGSTWSRHLLQISSQYYTSSIYWQAERKKDNAGTFKGTQYDFKERRGICTKTHRYADEVDSNFPGGAILLIRNPRQVLISRFMHEKLNQIETMEEQLKTRVEEIRNNSAKWRANCRQSIRGWKSLYTSWLEHAKRVLVVHHSHLCQNTVAELKRILNFLNLPTDMEKIQCAVDLHPCYLRDYLDFEPEFPDDIDEYVHELNQTLLEKHLPTIPN